MDCIAKYKNRVNRKGKTVAERKLQEGRHEFNLHFKDSPNSCEIQVTDIDEVLITENTRYVKCFVTNISLNDQNVLDEKYIHFSHDTVVDVGCYVYWHDTYWLLIFKEHNSVYTHNTFVMRRCNQIFKFKEEDVVYEIPISVTNLTLYSDGLSKGVYLTRQDSKRNILVGKNPITRLIEIGDRIMLTNLTVFRVTHIDNFTIDGLIEFTVLQMAVLPEDNLEENIAHNPNISKPTYEGELIQGEDVIYIGSELELIINEEAEVGVEWNIVSKNSSGIIKYQDANKCIIKAIGDSRHIGEEIVIDIYDLEDFSLLGTKIIKVKGYF